MQLTLKPPSGFQSWATNVLLSQIIALRVTQLNQGIELPQIMKAGKKEAIFRADLTGSFPYWHMVLCGMI